MYSRLILGIYHVYVHVQFVPKHTLEYEKLKKKVNKC